MKFERLYPVELIFRGMLSRSDAGLEKSQRLARVEEYFAVDKPDIIIDKIVEEAGLSNTEEKNFVYRISGFSTNPNVR